MGEASILVQHKFLEQGPGSGRPTDRRNEDCEHASREQSHRRIKPQHRHQTGAQGCNGKLGPALSSTCVLPSK